MRLNKPHAPLGRENAIIPRVREPVNESLERFRLVDISSLLEAALVVAEEGDEGGGREHLANLEPRTSCLLSQGCRFNSVSQAPTSLLVL